MGIISIVSREYTRSNGYPAIKWEIKDVTGKKKYIDATTVLINRDGIRYVSIFTASRNIFDAEVMLDFIKQVVEEYIEQADMIEIRASLYVKYHRLAQFNFQLSEILPDTYETKIPTKIWW